MRALEDMFRKEKIEFMNSAKDSIDISKFREIEILPNGDRFIHDLNAGYVVDGAIGNIKEWRVKVGNIGGPSGWVEAEYSWNGIIGPGGRNGLYPKPSMPMRF